VEQAADQKAQRRRAETDGYHLRSALTPVSDQGLRRINSDGEYGGAVITEAGNDPKVAGLVYITAFALDKGESVASLIKDPPPDAPVPPILPPQDGYLFLDKTKFAASFAADVEPEKAAFMADSHVPWGVEALSGTISEPAWKTKPSWYLLVTEDKMIPPPAQRFMSQRAGATVDEVAGSHAIYVSRPDAEPRSSRRQPVPRRPRRPERLVGFGATPEQVVGSEGGTWRRVSAFTALRSRLHVFPTSCRVTVVQV